MQRIVGYSILCIKGHEFPADIACMQSTATIKHKALCKQLFVTIFFFSIDVMCRCMVGVTMGMGSLVWETM